MVDWEAVEERRSKGWDWDRIAQDASVGFRPDPRPDQPGSALRAIYERRRRAARGKPPEHALPPSLAPPKTKRWSLAYVGYLLVPFFGIWGLVAYGLSAPVGTYLPAVPIVALLFAVAAFLLAFGLLRTSPRWSPSYRRAVIAGTLAGVVVVGIVGGLAALEGAPVLTPFVQPEPQGWEKLPGATWAEDGQPVVFFLGSAACPYCSATSWALVAALEAFGNLTGLSYGQSSTTDVNPSTPELVLAESNYQSPLLVWQPVESTGTTTVVVPPPSNVVEEAYISAYDAEGSIPFIVVAGAYAHVGSLVDPSALAGLTPEDTWGEVLNESGPAWNAVAPAAYLLEALMFKADGGQPRTVGENPYVAADLSEVH